MKYYSQYRIHDLFELQESLSGLSKSNRWVKPKLTQIRCLQADFQMFLDFLGKQAGHLLSCFSRHYYKCLKAAFKMYEQQKMMFEQNVRSLHIPVIAVHSAPC